jgi:tetratricopeptide (TPR) repeat protein
MREAFYAGTVPPRIGKLLEDAMSAYADTARAEELLQQARREAPQALPVYFSLYKFYFYKGRLAEAEQAARSALATAAAQGGFPDAYEVLTPDTTDWTRHDSPQHFYLFSLKALAFIRLRQGDSEGCERLLRKLRELDSADTVGGSVIGSLAAGL